MPPHLHPRSKFTSSLFATTLFASFFVVVLPHALPCPAPRVVYADENIGSDGEVESAQPGQRRRRRRRVVVEKESGSRTLEAADVDNVDERSNTDGGMLGSGGLERMKVKRECPVPKPSGLVGEIFGFGRSNSEESSSSNDGKGGRPP